jgi:hypothetical protein
MGLKAPGHVYPGAFFMQFVMLPRLSKILLLARGRAEISKLH